MEVSAGGGRAVDRLLWERGHPSPPPPPPLPSPLRAPGRHRCPAPVPPPSPISLRAPGRHQCPAPVPPPQPSPISLQAPGRHRCPASAAAAAEVTEMYPGGRYHAPVSRPVLPLQSRARYCARGTVHNTVGARRERERERERERGGAREPRRTTREPSEPIVSQLR